MDFKYRLENSEVRKSLIQHKFFKYVRNHEISIAQCALMLGQWYYPLHNFTNYLSRLVAVSNLTEVKTYISKILWQELGEGEPNRAHLTIYIQTMKRAGFKEETFIDVRANVSTIELIKQYNESTENILSGLGFLYGTEVADLAMVAGIGVAVRKSSGINNVPWVDIHVQQETQHVDSAEKSILGKFNTDEQDVIYENAKKIWYLWILFFDSLYQQISSDSSPKAINTKQRVNIPS